MKDTPSMRQYREIKEKYPDAILFFRMGDFYETFEDDAYITGKVLDIVVTSRDKGEDKTPMAGIPYHALMNYLPRMISAGYKVAICEQMENAKDVKGIVKREVVKVITPGTVLDSEIQNPKFSNIVLSIYPDFKNNIIGLAYIDITKGDLIVFESSNIKRICEIIQKVTPSEVLLCEDTNNLNQKQSEYFKDITFLTFNMPKSFLNKSDFEDGEEYLKKHFEVNSLKGFVKEILNPSIKAAGALLKYIEDNQRERALNIEKVIELRPEEYMYLDPSTISNLELLYSQNENKGKQKSTLIEVIDNTCNSMGARLLRNIIIYPLIEKNAIEERYNSVEYLYNSKEIETYRELLSKFSDIERINARISFLSANPRDFLSLMHSLEYFIILQSKFSDLDLPLLLKNIFKNEKLNEIAKEVIHVIANFLEESDGETISNSNIVKHGINQELDELKDILKGGKGWIKKFQEDEITRTGISSLKIKFNKVFGYYIEISNANKNKLPEDYIRRQTLVNAERYVTPLLKEKEDLILNAESRIFAIESKLFKEFSEAFVKYIKDIKTISNNISNFDVLLNFAFIAKKYNYVRPSLSSDSIRKPINIKEGRHPVIEQNIDEMNYISNDIYLDCFESQIVILTGPNMSGKSSALRMTALITLLAQIGSFVPAKSVDLYIVDRIFSRVGARDNLATGESTFLVEMNETANILNNATSNSLIILDEIGRGTSTYDGVSIAYAVVEYIHEKIGAKTIFATHYHELIDMENRYKRLVNFNVGVKDTNGKVLFLRKLIKGGTNRSYGIHVARIAGIPSDVIKRADSVLKGFEKEKAEIKKSFDAPLLSLIDDNEDTNIYNERFDKIQSLVNEVDINLLTPIDALNILSRLIKTIKDDD